MIKCRWSLWSVLSNTAVIDIVRRQDDAVMGHATETANLENDGLCVCFSSDGLKPALEAFLANR